MRKASRSMLPAFLLLVAACGDELQNVEAPTELNAEVLKFTDCDALDEMLRLELHSSVEGRAREYRRVWDELSEKAPLWGPAGPIAPSGSAGDGPAGNSPPMVYTDTDTQDAGIEEPDTVKTDGEWIYLVLPNGVGVYRVSPEGAPEAVDFLPGDGGGESQLLLAPSHLIVLRGVIAPLDVAQKRGWFAGDSAGTGGELWEGVPSPGGFTTHTRVRVYERLDGQHRLASDRIFDGRVIRARRHDRTVHVIITSIYDPFAYLTTHLLPPPSPWTLFKRGRRAKRQYLNRLDEWVLEAKALVDALRLEEFYPHQLFLGEQEGEYTIAPLECDRLYTRRPGQYKRSVLNLITFRLDDPESIDHLALFGESGFVYANHERLISTSRGWGKNTERHTEANFTETRTALQSFVFGERSSSHEASGLIEGWIHDQFSLDLHEGTLRAAVHFQEPPADARGDALSAPEIANKIITLTIEDGRFLRLGETPPLARGDKLSSARFIGDYGYLITHEMTAQLFVIDLRDPANPAPAGEVAIPGFSSYMHPLPPDHLLTIGPTLDDEEAGDLGLDLRIFDISEKSAPRALHQLTIPFAESLAEYDHRAFLYDDRLGLLALPLFGHRAPEPFPALSLFSISREDGIEGAGEIWHRFPPRPLHYHFIPRSLFINEHIYSISAGGMMVHALGDPLEEIAELAFD